MKKIFLLLISAFSISFYTSCSDNSEIEKDSIQSLAKEYGYKINDLDSKEAIFKVSNTIELKNHFESIKNSFKTPKIKNIGNFLTLKSISIEKQNLLIDSIYKELSSKKNKNIITYKSTKKSAVYEDDPPYKYSVTVNFDNSFPASNIYVTVNYNTNSTGNITGSEIVTGSYGYSFGNTYSQTGLNSFIQNNTLVFQVTGQFSTSIGIGSFSLSNSNFVSFTGLITIPQGGGNPSGWIAQREEELPPGDDSRSDEEPK